MYIDVFLYSEHYREKKESQLPEGRLDLRSAGIAGIWKTVKSLVTNVPYVCIVLYSVFDAIIVNGFVAFGPKFFQQQFGLTPTMAGILFGQFLQLELLLCLPMDVHKITAVHAFRQSYCRRLQVVLDRVFVILEEEMGSTGFLVSGLKQ